jgi:hypothetical protein
MQLKDLLTPKNPLGPFRHETIIKREDGTPSDILIYQTEAFDEIIDDARPIIVGRRGSGKTAIVAALAARYGRDDHSHGDGAATLAKGDIYVLINSWDHLDQLVIDVGTDARHSLGGDGDWSSLLPETTARHWGRRLWMVIFNRIYSESLYDSGIRTKLSSVVRYVQGKDIIAEDGQVSENSLNEKFNQTKQSVIKYLNEEKKKCLIVIDSLEEYPVLAPRFQKIISGLLKCVNDFNADYPSIRIVCCIPEEVEPHFIAKASNHLKDFSTSSVSKLRWHPIDLLRIVAERYREFLYIYSHDDRAFTKQIKKFDFGVRSHIRDFFSLFMPRTIKNSLEREEASLAYIIRHTQLLPREFLMIFDAAIVSSHKFSGSWRSLDHAAIVRAVESQEPLLALQVLQPYRSLYPDLLTAAQDVLPELPPICTLSDLDRVGARLRKMTRHETNNPWETLYQIGVLGYIDERPRGPSNEKYEYGRFHFNSNKSITFAAGRKYCVHPIFSGSWDLKRDDRHLKCVYPADVDEIPW